MNDTFRYTLLPVIIGANFHARLLAERYRRLYRVRSLVLHATYSPWLLFSLALRYRKLNRCGSHAEFMLHDLIRLAEDHPDKLLVLIATTPQDNAFLAEHPMICINGTFFTKEGRVTDENRLRKEILDWIEPYIASGLSKKITSLLDMLRVKCYAPPLPVYTDRIHLANGTYHLSGEFTPEKDFCVNRLPVSYDPEAAAPAQWLAFLDQLLYPEDISTLQEYMGYCLIPTNKAQKMMIITGNGGEGKSRLGLVMRSILGDNMSTSSIQSVERNRFTRATLEYKLLMVDDDMKLQALPETSYIKTMVTLEGKMDLEWKGKQSEQRMMYCRFLCFGNGPLLALYDRTHGFHRRQS